MGRLATSRPSLLSPSSDTRGQSLSNAVAVSLYNSEITLSKLTFVGINETFRLLRSFNPSSLPFRISCVYPTNPSLMLSQWSEVPFIRRGYHQVI